MRSSRAALLTALAADFFLSGTSVYLLAELHTAPWLPGAALALCTGLAAAGGTAAVRLTRRLQRTTVMALRSGLYAAWCAAPAVAALFSVASWLPWLLVGTAASPGVLLLRWLAAVLPAEVLRPDTGPAPAEPALHA